MGDPSIEGLVAALKAIRGPTDNGPFIEVYRAAGGGYQGLQAIAEAALETSGLSDHPERPSIEAATCPSCGGKKDRVQWLHPCHDPFHSDRCPDCGGEKDKPNTVFTNEHDEDCAECDHSFHFVSASQQDERRWTPTVEQLDAVIAKASMLSTHASNPETAHEMDPHTWAEAMIDCVLRTVEAVPVQETVEVLRGCEVRRGPGGRGSWPSWLNPADVVEERLR